MSGTPCIHFRPDDAGPRCTQPACRAPRDCPDCPSYQPAAEQLLEAERTRCEVWTRVMGYHRPVSAFNAGKQAEHRERTYFRDTHESTPETP